MKTGFTSLDKLPVAMKGGDLILIGARPGMGKTAFAINLAVNAAKGSKTSVHVFALEKITEQIVSRVLTYCQPFNDLSICTLPSGSTVDSLVNEVRARLGRGEGIAVIDCLQLIADEKKDNASDILRKLKLLAGELEVPLICCTRLPRNIEYRNDHRPALKDLRSVGVGLQYVDTAIFPYREAYYDFDSRSDIAEIIAVKNRYGDTGTVEMGWDGEHLRFYDKTFDK